MPRPSFIELLMLGALLILVGVCFLPRVAQESLEVRASRAVLVEHKLQRLYDDWRLAGGAHGPIDPQAPLSLTRNLLACFTSPRGVCFVSNARRVLPLSPSEVYEAAALSPSPSQYRLADFSVESPNAVPLAQSALGPREGILLSGGFVVAFDGTRWFVQAAP